VKTPIGFALLSVKAWQFGMAEQKLKRVEINSLCRDTRHVIPSIWACSPIRIIVKPGNYYRSTAKTPYDYQDFGLPDP
jgi:hypothetical protein